MEIKRQKRWYSSKETADYIGISIRSLYNQTGPRAKKKFPVRPKRVGRLLKFDRRELEAYLESL
jgi:predicted DNA-binding transcriptional regulator AlpA